MKKDEATSKRVPVTYANEEDDSETSDSAEEEANFSLLSVEELQREVEKAKAQNVLEINSLVTPLELFERQKSISDGVDASRRGPEYKPRPSQILVTSTGEDNAEVVSESNGDEEIDSESISSQEMETKGEGPGMTWSERIIAAQEIELAHIRNTMTTRDPIEGDLPDGEPSHVSSHTELNHMMNRIEKLQKKVTQLEVVERKLREEIQIRDDELHKQKLGGMYAQAISRWHGEVCRYIIDLYKHPMWPIICVCLVYGGLMWIVSSTMEVWNSDHGSYRDLYVAAGIPFAFIWALVVSFFFTMILIFPFYFYSWRFWADHDFIWWRYECVRAFILCIFSGYVIVLCCIHRSAFLIAPYNESSFCSIEYLNIRLLCRPGEYLITPIHQTYKIVTKELPMSLDELLTQNFTSDPVRVFHRSVDSPYLEDGRSIPVVMPKNLELSIRPYGSPPTMQVSYFLEKPCYAPDICIAFFEGLVIPMERYEVLVPLIPGSHISVNDRDCLSGVVYGDLISCGFFSHGYNVSIILRNHNVTIVQAEIRTAFEIEELYDGTILDYHGCQASFVSKISGITHRQCIDRCMDLNCAVAHYEKEIGTCFLNDTNHCNQLPSNTGVLFQRTPNEKFSRDIIPDYNSKLYICAYKDHSSLYPCSDFQRSYYAAFSYSCVNEVFDHASLGVNDSFVEVGSDLETCLECTQRCSRLRDCIGVVCDMGSPCIFVPKDTHHTLSTDLVPMGDSSKTCYKTLHRSPCGCDYRNGTWCAIFCGGNETDGLGPDCAAKVTDYNCSESAYHPTRASQCVGEYMSKDFNYHMPDHNKCGDFCLSIGVTFFLFDEHSSKCACRRICGEPLPPPSNRTTYEFIGRGKCVTTKVSGEKGAISYYDVSFESKFSCQELCDLFLFCIGFHVLLSKRCYIYVHFDHTSPSEDIYQPMFQVTRAHLHTFAESGYVDGIENVVSGEECWQKGGEERQWEFANHFMDPSAIITVNSGAYLHEIQEELMKHKLSLLGVPRLAEITVLEAINTGMWGRDFSMLSTYVYALDYLDASGNIEHIGNDDERLEAFRLDLGLLGIITRVELVAFPLLYVKKHSKRTSDYDIKEFLNHDLQNVNRQVKIKNFGKSKKAVLEWHEITTEPENDETSADVWQGYAGAGAFWYYGILPLFLATGHSFFVNWLMTGFFATRPPSKPVTTPFSRADVWETDFIGVRHMEYFVHMDNCKMVLEFVENVMHNDKHIHALEFVITKPRVVKSTLLGFDNVGSQLCSIAVQYMISGDFWRAQYTLEEITSHILQVGGICAWYMQCYGLEYMDALHLPTSTFARHVLQQDHHGQFFNEFYAHILNLYTSYPGIGLECSRYEYVGEYDNECDAGAKAGDDCGGDSSVVKEHCISIYNYGTLHCGSCREFYRFSSVGSWSPVEHQGASAWKDVDATLEHGLATCRTASQLCIFTIVLLVVASLSCCLTVDPDPYEEEYSESMSGDRETRKFEEEIQFFE